MRRVVSVASMVVVAVATVAAQQSKPAAPAGKPTSVSMVATGPIATSVKAQFDEVKDWVLRSAQMVTDKEYEFRPQGISSDVRNYGQILGHIANTNYAYCGASMGLDSPPEQGPKGEDFQKITTKVEMQKALMGSFAYCDKAFNMVNDHNGGDSAKAFGTETTRLGALTANDGHLMEHYGNLVTYLRAMGKVPPSSQR